MSTIKLPYSFRWSPEYNHVAYVDLFDNGVEMEVVVMALDAKNGDLHYIRTDYLDDIDRRRMLQIVESNSASTLPLWEVMYNKTLPNGVNALEYFDQYAKTKLVSGQHLARTSASGRRGIYNSQYTVPEVKTITGEKTSIAPEQPQSIVPAQQPRRPGRPPTKRG